MRRVLAGIRARGAKGGSIRVCGALFLAVVTCVALLGQAQAPGDKVYTLDQAISYALANYPAVRASLERVNAAQSGIRLAHTQYLPSLTGAYQDSRATQNQVPGIWMPTSVTPTVEGPTGASSSGQSFWGSQVAALFSWEPIDFGLRPAMMTRARSAADKSNADLAVTRLQVAASAGDYFLMALASQQAAAAAQANVDRWEVFDQSIHDLVSSELRPGADGSRADAQLALAKTQLYRAQQAEQATLATLAALMGTAGSEIRLESGPLLGLPPSASLPNAASADHPLARDEMAEVREIQAQEKILDKSDHPRIYLQAEGFGRGSDIPNNGATIGSADGLEPGRGNWVAGITISFPNVFDFKALNWQKQISKADERSQQAEYDKTIQDVTGQVQTAMAELKTAQLVAQQTTIELDAARSSETQSRARYDASLTTLVDVADAENLLAQAEMDDAVARLNVWRGLFDVAYAQGDLQPFLDLLRNSGH
jgi:outer membrane protein